MEYFLKFHFFASVIPVGMITALCYTNLRPDIKKSSMSQDRHYWKLDACGIGASSDSWL